MQKENFLLWEFPNCVSPQPHHMCQPSSCQISCSLSAATSRLVLAARWQSRNWHQGQIFRVAERFQPDRRIDRSCSVLSSGGLCGADLVLLQGSWRERWGSSRADLLPVWTHLLWFIQKTWKTGRGGGSHPSCSAFLGTRGAGEKIMKQKLKTTFMKVCPAPSLVLCCDCQKFLMIPWWSWCPNPLLVTSSSYFQFCSWPRFPLAQTWRQPEHLAALLPYPFFLTFCLSKQNHAGSGAQIHPWKHCWTQLHFAWVFGSRTTVCLSNELEAPWCYLMFSANMAVRRVPKPFAFEAGREKGEGSQPWGPRF